MVDDLLWQHGSIKFWVIADWDRFQEWMISRRQVDPLCCEWLRIVFKDRFEIPRSLTVQLAGDPPSLTAQLAGVAIHAHWRRSWQGLSFIRNAPQTTLNVPFLEAISKQCVSSESRHRPPLRQQWMRGRSFYFCFRPHMQRHPCTSFQQQARDPCFPLQESACSSFSQRTKILRFCCTDSVGTLLVTVNEVPWTRTLTQKTLPYRTLAIRVVLFVSPRCGPWKSLLIMSRIAMDLLLESSIKKNSADDVTAIMAI